MLLHIPKHELDILLVTIFSTLFYYWGFKAKTAYDIHNRHYSIFHAFSVNQCAAQRAPHYPTSPLAHGVAFNTKSPSYPYVSPANLSWHWETNPKVPALPRRATSASLSSVAVPPSQTRG